MSQGLIAHLPHPGPPAEAVKDLVPVVIFSWGAIFGVLLAIRGLVRARVGALSPWAELLMQQRPQKPPGRGTRVLRHLFRGVGSHEFTPAVAAFRVQVDEVARGLDDLEVVAERVTRVLRV